jgi:hypothetical protein
MGSFRYNDWRSRHSPLTPLGVVVEWVENSDQGQLFFMALIAFLLCTISLIQERIRKHDAK